MGAGVSWYVTSTKCVCPAHERVLGSDACALPVLSPAEAAALAAANKRIRNILKKAEGEVPATVDPALFTEDAERTLADALHAALADTDASLASRDYVAVLTRIASLRPSVDAFFDGVMVNAEDQRVRGNRLALLKKLADRLGSVAAIEHLSA